MQCLYHITLGLLMRHKRGLIVTQALLVVLQPYGQLFDAILQLIDGLICPGMLISDVFGIQFKLLVLISCKSNLYPLLSDLFLQSTQLPALFPHLLLLDGYLEVV